MRKLIPTDPASVAAEKRKQERDLAARGISPVPEPIVVTVPKIEKKEVKKKKVVKKRRK